MFNLSNSIYTLMSLKDFKSVLGIDDREDKLAKFCLVTATLTIESYCKRNFVRKTHFETTSNYQLTINEDTFLQLREYPVSKVLAVYTFTGINEHGEWAGDILETEFYRVVPDCGTDINIPFTIEFSPAVARLRCKSFKVVYRAGYEINNEETETNNEQEDVSSNSTGKIYVPADLQAACLELASWNMNRYKGRRVGMSGNIKGAGIQGEHFELSVPENVKLLLEPYRRKTI